MEKKERQQQLEHSKYSCHCCMDAASQLTYFWPNQIIDHEEYLDWAEIAGADG